MAHIVHIANFVGPRTGGIRTVIEALGAGYAAAGHDFTAVTAGAVPEVRRGDTHTVITIPATPIPLSGGYRVVLRPSRVVAVLEALGPDRLEISDRTTLQGLGGWATGQSIPSLLFLHERVGEVLGAFGIPNYVADAVAAQRNRALARDGTAVVASTRYAAAEVGPQGGDVTIVPLGVDLDRFGPRPPSPLGAPSRQSIELVLCSRLSTEKAPHVAIDAVEVLRGRGIDARLTILGSGPLLERLRRRAVGLPVTFAGFVSDRARLAAELARADVALAPGPHETFGLAALEALASGTPVIGNLGSALHEVIGPDTSAGRVALGTGVAFAEAVEGLLAVPATARREAARRRAEQFTWPATVRGLLDLHGLATEPASPVVAGERRRPVGEARGS